MTQSQIQRHTVRDIAALVPVTAYLSASDYLREIYQRTKARVEGYSYLSFAADLGFSRTNVLRLIITGARPLSVKAGDRLAKGLDLHGAQRRYWTTLVRYANSRSPSERDHLFQLLMGYKTMVQPSALAPMQAEYFSEWYHPIIREMTALADFNGDPEWIKGRLSFPLRLEQIKHSLDILTKLGLVHVDSATGLYRRSVERVVTDTEIDSLAIVRYHQKMIEIGRESITTVPEDSRDIRAVTVTLPKATIALLKTKIEEMILQIAALEDPDRPGDQVVQVNIQMFPFTKM